MIKNTEDEQFPQDSAAFLLHDLETPDIFAQAKDAYGIEDVWSALGLPGQPSMSEWSTMTSKGVTSLCYSGKIQLRQKGLDAQRALEAQAAFLNERGLAPSLATCLADGGEVSRFENEATTPDMFLDHEFTPKHGKWELNRDVEK